MGNKCGKARPWPRHACRGLDMPNSVSRRQARKLELHRRKIPHTNKACTAPCCVHRTARECYENAIGGATGITATLIVMVPACRCWYRRVQYISRVVLVGETARF